eukprot:6648531-Karenia_brevis.AAC.2
MQPCQLARRVGSGSARRHCWMRFKDRGLCLDVISFNAAISACGKGGQRHFMLMLTRVPHLDN